jgi:hypothetical protein
MDIERVSPAPSPPRPVPVVVGVLNGVSWAAHPDEDVETVRAAYRAAVEANRVRRAKESLRILGVECASTVHDDHVQYDGRDRGVVVLAYRWTSGLAGGRCSLRVTVGEMGTGATFHAIGEKSLELAEYSIRETLAQLAPPVLAMIDRAESMRGAL